MRRMHWTNNQGNGKSRRKRNTQNTAPKKPMQSELSKRWISECFERGPSSRNEAIQKVQEEAEDGKDTSFSMPYLARLIQEKDRYTSLSAAWAAGTCAAYGADPRDAIQPMVNLLHSGDDLIVETAIEMLGECAKHPNQMTRKIILNKLAEINRNGASDETKANAGFALAEMISCSPDLLLDKTFKTKARSILLNLSRSDHYQSKAAGAAGIGNMAIATVRNKGFSVNDPDSFLKFLPVSRDDLLSEITISTLEQIEDILNNSSADFYAYVSSLLAGAQNDKVLERASEIIKRGLAIERTRDPIMRMLEYWEAHSESSLSRLPLIRKMVDSMEQGIEMHDLPKHMELSNEERVWMNSFIAGVDFAKVSPHYIRDEVLSDQNRDLMKLKQLIFQTLKLYGTNFEKEKLSQALNLIRGNII